MRLIDADALTEKVLKWMPPDPCGHEEKEFPFETDICASMLMEIEEAPTIEPRPRGRWTRKHNVHGAVYCSLCDYELHTNDTNFCPDCGADMREEEQDD